MKKLLVKISVSLILVLAIIAVLFFFVNSGKESKVTVDDGRINEVKAMVRLCAMEIYKEVPVLDTIGKKVVVAVQKQQGSISFDIENLQIDAEGDTVRMVLPKEIVEIRESTDDDSWQVIDTKNIGFLGSFRSDRLSEREENRLKAKLKRNSIDMLYNDGTVERAKVEAAKNLKDLLEKIYRKPAHVDF